MSLLNIHNLYLNFLPSKKACEQWNSVPTKSSSSYMGVLVNMGLHVYYYYHHFHLTVVFLVDHGSANSPLTDCVVVYVQLDTKQVILRRSSQSISWLSTEQLKNTTKQRRNRNKIYYNRKITQNNQSPVSSPPTTSGLKTERPYSGFGTS